VRLRIVLDRNSFRGVKVGMVHRWGATHALVLASRPSPGTLQIFDIA
jgi:hypothetical protein